MYYTDEKITKKVRKYYSENLDVSVWENVEKELKSLLNFEINSSDELIFFLKKYSELSFILDEEMAFRYIKMTCFADNSEYEKKVNDFNANIIAKAKPYDFKVNKKFYESKYRKDLSEKKYSHLNRIISNDIELFREKNVSLMVEERELANKYGRIYGGMTVEFEGEEKTLAQLSIYMKNKDRNLREKVWKLKNERLAQEKEKLDQLFDELKTVREKIAKNAGFDNYRDFKHQEMGRFSYSPEELYEFHDAVEKVVIPFLKELDAERKEKLGVEKLRPWDIAVDLDGNILKPFESIEQLIEKSTSILYNIKPDFGLNLDRMNNSNLLDLDNRKGKAPGGYNYPLEEMGTSFIFMNAVGLQSDVATLLHESGHALHTKAMKNEPIFHYKGTPSEVAELASMTMELLSMDHWDKFYSNKNDLIKAKKEQIEGTLKFLPWCMIVDAFQQWIYTNPNHNSKERSDYFSELMKRFNTGVCWDDLDEQMKILWMNQLHIFEVPFYYIEYGMAQLGALAIYKNFKENPDKTIKQYEEFLALGYTVAVDEIYKKAGIRFDFSEKYIGKLMDFVKKELLKLK